MKNVGIVLRYACRVGRVAVAAGVMACIVPRTYADFIVGFADVCNSSGTPAVAPAGIRDVFSAHGATTRILGWTNDLTVVTQMVSEVDLLVLCGGADVDPARYGATRQPYCGASNLKRDAFEWSILDAATALHKPVFGICRGNQVINAYYGGTLYQDIATEVGAAHASSHYVQIVDGGFLKPIFQTSCQKVNSTHHQAVKKLAPGFTAVAYAFDGVVEAIEDKQRGVRGVQFHPESLAPSDPKFAAIFRWLVTGELPGKAASSGTPNLVAK